MQCSSTAMPISKLTERKDWKDNPADYLVQSQPDAKIHQAAAMQPRGRCNYFHELQSLCLHSGVLKLSPNQI